MISAWKRKLQFEEIYEGRYALVCPLCSDSGGMHHVTVTTYSREEDAAQVLTTIVVPGVVSSYLASSKESTNPSARRDGVRIGFRCEHCTGMGGEPFHLEIAQHKGLTYMVWEKAITTRRLEPVQDTTGA